MTLFPQEKKRYTIWLDGHSFARQSVCSLCNSQPNVYVCYIGRKTYSVHHITQFMHGLFYAFACSMFCSFHFSLPIAASLRYAMLLCVFSYCHCGLSESFDRYCQLAAVILLFDGLMLLNKNVQCLDVQIVVRINCGLYIRFALPAFRLYFFVTFCSCSSLVSSLIDSTYQWVYGCMLQTEYSPATVCP